MNNIKELTKAENEVLTELQTVKFQDLPLIDLVVKNIVERNISSQKMSNVLAELQYEGKIDVSENTLSQMLDFTRIVIAHYEFLHKKRQSENV